MGLVTTVRKRRRRRSKRVRLHEYLSPKAGLVKLRSKWELEYLQWLDANPNAIAVSYEKLVILYYTGAGKRRKLRRYYPDFVVEWSDGRREIVEVKRADRVTNRLVIKKALAAGDYAHSHGMTYVLITEVELRELGLLQRRTVKI